MLRRLLRLPVRSRRQVAAEMRDEIDAHIAIGVDALVARGVDPVEADRQVRARFADLDAQLPSLVESARKRSRGSARRELWRTLLRDLAFAFRQARRSPAFSAGVVLSLAFGIGSTTAVYSWMQGIVVRPLPAVRDYDRLVSLRPDRRSGFGISLDEYLEWRDQAGTIDGLAAASFGLFAVDAADSPLGEPAQPIYGVFVSSNYFDVLGVAPARGRAFVPSDGVEGAPPVALVSDAFWRNQLGGAADVPGREIRVNGRTVRIVGVAPRNFGGTLAGVRFDIWVPLGARPALVPSDASKWRRRDHRWLDAFGRLRPGVELAAANAELRAIARRQAAAFKENVGRDARVIPFDIGSARMLEPLFIALISVTTLVVLLICSNVANLLLTRAATRNRELAVRLSLGASRRRLVTQLLTESTGLAVIGALLGVGLAMIGTRTLTSLVPTTSVAVGIQSELDIRFIAFVVAVTGTCVLAFGLAPAVIGSRVDLVDSLKSGGRGSAASRSRARTGLVVSQFVFALSTLVAAALFVRWDRNVHDIDVGFSDARHVLIVQTEISLAGRRDMTAWGRSIEQATAKIRSLPGVRSAAIGSFVPLGLVGYWRETVTGREATGGSDDSQRVLVNGVGAGYFDLMGIPILQGRPITDDDTPGRPAAAVVNQTFAERFFSGESPIGRTFALGGRPHVIVGVARDGRYDYRDISATGPLVYRAWKQTPSGFVTIHVRTAGDPLLLSTAVRSAIHDLDPAIRLIAPVTLHVYSGVPFYVSRAASVVLTILAAVALALASMGLFSVISYGVTLRTREIGIRIALGATQISVTTMFLRNALQLLAVGTAAGIGASILLVGVLRSRIPLLPAAAVNEFVVPILTLSLFAVTAGLIPAIRAAAVDPARTLRSE